MKVKSNIKPQIAQFFVKGSECPFLRQSSTSRSQELWSFISRSKLESSSHFLKSKGIEHQPATCGWYFLGREVYFQSRAFSGCFLRRRAFSVVFILRGAFPGRGGFFKASNPSVNHLESQF